MNKERTMLLLEGSTYLHTNNSAITYAMEEIGNVTGAVILGSIEKIGEPEELKKLSIPVIYDSALNSIERIQKGLAEFQPEKVYDLAGAPTVLTSTRNEFASVITASGATYEGLDFTFTGDRNVPLLRDFILHRTDITTLGFLGTGKRVGKTSVINTMAKLMDKYRPVFITMGRGGPVTPVLISPEGYRLTHEHILELSKKSGHICSDNWQTALSTGFPVIGCFRVGEAYRTGVAAFSNVWEGTKMAEKLAPELLIYQGSGIARPPVRLNGEIVIIGADQDPETFGKIERYSIIKGDMIVITKCDTGNKEKLRKFLDLLVSTHLIIETVFKPRPLIPEHSSLKGKKVIFFTTAPPCAIESQKKYLEEHYECQIVNHSNNLANKKLLSEDMKKFKDNFDTVLTEFKAAAIMVMEEMLQRGKEVIICENELIAAKNQDLKSALNEVIGMAFARNSY